MLRLIEKLRKVDLELQAESSSVVMLSDERKRSIHDEIYRREAEILPVYRNLPESFCDLHENLCRMLAKGAVRKIVPSKEARRFFMGV